MHNDIKHLMKAEFHFLNDFKKCMYDYEYEE